MRDNEPAETFDSFMKFCMNNRTDLVPVSNEDLTLKWTTHSDKNRSDEAQEVQRA